MNSNKARCLLWKCKLNKALTIFSHVNYLRDGDREDSWIVSGLVSNSLEKMERFQLTKKSFKALARPACFATIIQKPA